MLPATHGVILPLVKTEFLNKNKLFWKSFFIIIVFAAGIFAGIIFDKNSPKSQAVREDSSGYKFINPFLFTMNSGTNVSAEYKPLKKIINSYINDELDKKDASDISVYFRTLNSGEWISINDDETFSPASMLKVVTLIAVMREAEINPNILDTKIKIKGNDADLANSQERYPVQDPIRSGNTYSVNTLVAHLIVDSDNVANAALIQILGDDKINKVYSDLKLVPPKENNLGYTAEEYSHLFRALYNATYLSRSVSEKVLELLSKTTFQQGIVSGLPKTTVTSHKFGIKTVLSGNNQEDVDYRELHDCGIVYYPENPYFICIMTRGADFDNLEKIIQTTSRLTWDYFNKHFAK